MASTQTLITAVGDGGGDVEQQKRVISAWEPDPETHVGGGYPWKEEDDWSYGLSLQRGVEGFSPPSYVRDDEAPSSTCGAVEPLFEEGGEAVEEQKRVKKSWKPDFPGGDGEFLSLIEGELLVVCPSKKEEGWAYGRSLEREVSGFFPPSHRFWRRSRGYARKFCKLFFIIVFGRPGGERG